MADGGASEERPRGRWGVRGNMFIYWQASESVSDPFPTSQADFSLLESTEHNTALLINKDIDIKLFFKRQIWLQASIIKTCWLRLNRKPRFIFIFRGFICWFMTVHFSRLLAQQGTLVLFPLLAIMYTQWHWDAHGTEAANLLMFLHTQPQKTLHQKYDGHKES